MKCLSLSLVLLLGSVLSAWAQTTTSPIIATTCPLGQYVGALPVSGIPQCVSQSVANNTALKALIGVPGQAVLRLGFAAAGDGGGAVYGWSGISCAIPDDGAQVQPNSTGCWIADFSSDPSVKVWGAKGDGTTDDSVAVRKAVVARKAAPLRFPVGNYRLCSEIASTDPMNIVGVGSGAGPGVIQTSGNTIFTLCNANQNGFRSSNYFPSRFSGFWLTSAVQQASGYAGIVADTASAATMTRWRFDDVALGSEGYNSPLTLYDGIKQIKPTYPDYNRIYCQGWVNSCINHTTTSGVEGSGGYIHNSYFFGNPDSTSQGPAIYSEIGYTWISNNEILGGSDGIQFCYKNNPASETVIHHNTIENSRFRGILLQSCDGSAASMVHIVNNEFSNYSFTANMSAEIQISEYPTAGGTQVWLSNLMITNNIFRSTLISAAKYIWVSAGKNAIISSNIIEDLGVNNPIAIQVTGANSNNSLAPKFLVRDNQVLGTTNRFSGGATASPFYSDVSGLYTVATLPSVVGLGSTVVVSNGTPNTQPCTSGGTGAIATWYPTGWKC